MFLLKEKSDTELEENFKSDFLSLIEEFEIKKIDFVHDMFTADPNRIYKLCTAIENNKLKIEWGCSSRIDVICSELLLAMKNAGCKGIFIGVETGSKDIQKKINKNLNIDQIIETINLISEYSINVNVSFILGFPFETIKDFYDTLILRNTLLNTGVQEAIIDVLMPLPGSNLYLEESISNFKFERYYEECLIDDIKELINNNNRLFSYSYFYKSHFYNDSVLFILKYVFCSKKFSISSRLLIELFKFKDFENFIILANKEKIISNILAEEFYLSFFSKNKDKYEVIYDVINYEVNKYNLTTEKNIDFFCFKTKYDLSNIHRKIINKKFYIPQKTYNHYLVKNHDNKTKIYSITSSDYNKLLGEQNE